ncbi:MAG: hypothetical protein KIT69_18100, partial [Propionibacteriaceae bacterium]|nr:hypothetical protein [Propionibacteriaceae bacterium]
MELEKNTHIEICIITNFICLDCLLRKFILKKLNKQIEKIMFDHFEGIQNNNQILIITPFNTKIKIKKLISIRRSKREFSIYYLKYIIDELYKIYSFNISYDDLVSNIKTTVINYFTCELYLQILINNYKHIHITLYPGCNYEDIEYYYLINKYDSIMPNNIQHTIKLFDIVKFTHLRENYKIHKLIFNDIYERLYNGFNFNTLNSNYIEEYLLKKLDLVYLNIIELLPYYDFIIKNIIDPLNKYEDDKNLNNLHKHITRNGPQPTFKILNDEELLFEYKQYLLHKLFSKMTSILLNNCMTATNNLIDSYITVINNQIKFKSIQFLQIYLYIYDLKILHYHIPYYYMIAEVIINTFDI